MRWNSVQQDAWRKRHLIFAMDQAQTDVLTKPGPWAGVTPAGYCMGLVASWVSLQYKGENFLHAEVMGIPGMQACETPPWDSTIAQTASQAVDMRGGSAAWFRQMRAAARLYQCTLSPGLRAVRGTPANADFLWSVMAKAYGCYFVMMGGTDGSHVIALRHGRDNRYHLFDPNHFHIRMPDKAAFLEYTARYLRMAGYSEAYGVENAVVGVRPPI